MEESEEGIIYLKILLFIKNIALILESKSIRKRMLWGLNVQYKCNFLTYNLNFLLNNALILRNVYNFAC